MKISRHPSQTGVALLLALSLLFALLQPASAQSSPQPRPNGEDPETVAPIAPALASAFARQRGPVSFLVILDEQADPETLLQSARMRTASADARRAEIYRQLTARAAESQAPLRAWLDGRGIPYRAFWLTNMLEVQGDAALAESLRGLPGVNRLAANPSVKLDMPAQEEAKVLVWPRSRFVPNTTPIPEQPYGIRYANAPQVWGMGYRGAGIVLASQDTGVYWEHEALKEQYRGWDPATLTATHEYNWFDFFGTANRGGCDPDPQVPCDDSGHGTHTVGTLVGNDERTAFTVGMAPDAQWIGCRNMNRGNGTPASYTGCFEFFIAPYPQDGDKFTDGDPSKAPHIINNSWYCPPSEGCDFDSLRQVVQLVRLAGLMVVVSAGNNGPTCSSVKYPISAYPEVFSVGAHGETGGIVGFSSRGPVTADSSGRLKPEIAAAGLQVISTSVGGNYIKLSGTSMASPHVAGAVALLWSAVPELVRQISETEQILMKSADAVLSSECEVGGVARSPNNTYGHGRLDALAAVNLALNPASLAVQVGGPGRSIISGAVFLTDQQTGYRYAAPINGEGVAVFERVYAGTYNVNLDSPEAQSQPQTLELAQSEQKLHVLNLQFELYYPLVTK